MLATAEAVPAPVCCGAHAAHMQRTATTSSGEVILFIAPLNNKYWGCNNTKISRCDSVLFLFCTAS